MTPSAARDAILGRFKTQWDADTPAITTTIPPIDWENVKDIVHPSPQVPYARVTMADIETKIHSLGGIGGRLYHTTGTVVVEVFVPWGIKGRVTADALGNVVMEAFLGKTAGDEVRFEDVSGHPLGVVDGMYANRVVAFYNYDRTA